MIKIPDCCRPFVARWESFEAHPYPDVAGIQTIGFGHAIRDESGFVRDALRADALYPQGVTVEEAATLLQQDMASAAEDVERLVKVPLTDGQRAALISFQFNVGALGRSTLLKKLNAGDYEGAAGEFGRWVKARKGGGPLVTVSGLVRRRAAEKALFQTADTERRFA